MTKYLVLFWTVFVVLGNVLGGDKRLNLFTPESYKKLQGPPSDFPNFVIPGPDKTPQVSKAAYIPIYLDKYGTWNGQFFVDSDELFSFCGFSKDSSEFEVKIGLPGNKQLRPLQAVLVELNGFVETSPLGLGSAMVMMTCYSFPTPPLGAWHVNVHLPGQNPDKLSPIGYWIIFNESPIQLKTFNSEDLLTGQTLTLIAAVTNEKSGQILLFNGSVSCEAYLETPNGKTVTVKMNDEGINGDTIPGDGIFGGQFILPQAGGYSTETVFQGKLSNGLEIIRATLHYFAVVTSDISLQPSASAVMKDGNMIISLQVTGKEEGDDTHIVYSQVWGTSKDGQTQIPIAWVSGMTDRQANLDGATSTLVMTLDQKWISLAKAYPPFFLKQTRVQDRDLQTLLDEVDMIAIKLGNQVPPEVYSMSVPEITREMRQGKMPEKLRNLKNSTDANHKLLLIHGYCSDGPPFSSEDFTNFVVFNDPYANRNLDEFTQLIQQLVTDNKIDTFSIVAHSQGGLASLHMSTYYFTGLDAITTGRKIQSIGSPYQGTTLAGGLASIGRIFGYGCGSNDGLTKAGAAEWLAGIPQENRAEIYYTTTEGTTTCSSGANFIGLEQPNDAVVARDFGQLPGANNEGHLIGWCHISGYSSPNQCQNHENNQKMNSLAGH